MPYNTIAMRKLLEQAFDEESFYTFCFDYARPVHQQFTTGQTQGQRVQLLIEYALRTNSLEQTLRHIEQANPWRYAEFRPLLTTKAESDSDDLPIIVQSLPTTLQKYDLFFEQWMRSLARLDPHPLHYARSVIAGLASSLKAELGFVLVSKGVTWEPTISIDDRAMGEVRQLLKNSRIRELLSQAARHQNATYVGALGETEPFLFAPLVGEKSPSLLVFTGLKDTLFLDSAIGIVLETVLATTNNLRQQIGPEILELNVYHALRQGIGRVSDAMYNRQFELYSRRLKTMTVFFEPIVYLHPTQPYIWGWEALARDPATLKAPIDLFQIAEVWGRRFQLELDMHFLRTAIHTYLYDTAQGEKQRFGRRKGTAGAKQTDKRKVVRARKEELQPLAINVYPESLIRTRYYETLRELYLEGLMPINKLTLEISEKSALPKPTGEDAHREQYDWFREYLQRLGQFDVRFAIDDFGVGYASPERLSRLGVSVVKIDRNALLYKLGDSTINYVTSFARSIPGYVQVIIEGVDYESLFPLRTLFDQHIRYVQGHLIGVARPGTDRLEKEDVEHIRAALQAPADGKH